MLEWLKTILGEAYTDDIDKRVSAEIGKGFVSKADFNAKNEALKTAQGTIEELQKGSGDIEEMRKKIGAYEKAENDRKDAEQKAAARAEITGRFDKALDERKFAHEYIRNGVLSDFEKALADDANKGKGDSEIFDSLTKDKDGLFQSMNPPAQMRGTGGTSATELDDAKIDAIMGILPQK